MAGKWMTPLAAVWSLRPWNSNPLVRRAERVEGAVMILAVAAVLLVVPIAAAVGTAVYSAEAVAIRVERSSRHVVEAVVVDEPRKSVGEQRTATARWYQGDHPHTATVPVGRSVERGDHFDLWLGPDGAPTEAPRGSDAAPTTGVTVGVLVLGITVACGFWAVVGTRAWYRRRSAVNWEREWVRFDRSARGEWS